MSDSRTQGFSLTEGTEPDDVLVSFSSWDSNSMSYSLPASSQGGSWDRRCNIKARLVQAMFLNQKIIVLRENVNNN